MSAALVLTHRGGVGEGAPIMNQTPFSNLSHLGPYDHTRGPLTAEDVVPAELTVDMEIEWQIFGVVSDIGDLSHMVDVWDVKHWPDDVLTNAAMALTMADFAKREWEAGKTTEAFQLVGWAYKHLSFVPRHGDIQQADTTMRLVGAVEVQIKANAAKWQSSQ